MNTHKRLKLLATAILTPVMAVAFVGCENYYAGTTSSGAEGSDIDYTRGFPGTSNQGTSLSPFNSPMNTFPSSTTPLYTEADVETYANANDSYVRGSWEARNAHTPTYYAPKRFTSSVDTRGLNSNPAGSTLGHNHDHVSIMTWDNRQASAQYVRGAPQAGTKISTDGGPVPVDAVAQRLIIRDADVSQAQRLISNLEADPGIYAVEKIGLSGQDHFWIDVLFAPNQVREGIVERVGNIIAPL